MWQKEVTSSASYLDTGIVCFFAYQIMSMPDSN
jgi:hypothetical protein